MKLGDLTSCNSVHYNGARVEGIRVEIFIKTEGFHILKSGFQCAWKTNFPHRIRFSNLSPKHH